MSLWPWDDLPLQVRFVDDVELDDPQVPSTQRPAVHQRRGPEATGSNTETWRS